METKQKFDVFCPNLIKSVDATSEDLILEGVATTTGVDLEGDYMTRECIKSLKEQILPLNIHMSHKKDTQDVVGSVLDVIETDDDTLKIKFIVLPSYRDFIEELLDYGVNLGLSIRGKALDYVKTDTGLKVNQVKLLEVSLTPLPANWETFGTVKKAEQSITSQCFNGACMQLVKSMSTEQESKEEKFDDSEDVSLGEQKVIDLINEAFSNFEDRIIKYLESEYRIGDIKQFLQNTSTTESNEQSEEESAEDSKILSDESVDEETEKNDEKSEEEDEDEDEMKKSLVVGINFNGEHKPSQEDIAKSFNEVITTETKETFEMTEEIEKTENIEVTEQVEEVVEAPIEKEIDLDVDEITKSIEDKIVENEELIKSISEKVIEKVTEQLSTDLVSNVTDSILKDLSSNREPVSVEIPKIELKKEEEITNQPMNRYDIAKSLARRE